MYDKVGDELASALESELEVKDDKAEDEVMVEREIEESRMAESNGDTEMQL